jgi:SAM-dependent methyltransferase
MNKITDPEFLRTDQYKDSSNLSKRANLHQDYGTNPANWQRWIYNLIRLPSDAAMLDLGCGPGYFWKENENAVPAGWNIYLTDISGGMLGESRDVLKGKNRLFYIVCDAQEIPLPGDVFDAVIANHMLYHVRDLDKTLKGIQRVIQRGGSFYTATNGKNHLFELRNLELDYFQDENPDSSFWAESFNLNNGQDILNRYFNKIECHEYPNKLQVTDPNAIIDYLKSKSMRKLDPDSIGRVLKFLRKEISIKGYFEIQSEAGLFICQNS